MTNILAKHFQYLIIILTPDIVTIVSESFFKDSRITNELLSFDKEIDTIQFILLIVVMVKFFYDVYKESLKTVSSSETISLENKNKENREILKHKKENIKF